MPSSALTYPGVYVEEVKSGVRTITGVATSITAFIGRTARGEVNKPKTLNSYADFEREFGGLWLDSTVSYAVRDFYLNGGSKAVVVRLFRPHFADDAARLKALDEAKAKAKDAADAVAKAANDAATAQGATKQSVADAAVAKCSDYKDKGPKEAAAAAAAVAAAAVAKVASAADAAAVAAAAGDAVASAVTNAASEAAPRTTAKLSANGLELEAASEGSWGNALRVRIDHDVKNDPDNKLFNLTVRDGITGQVEVFRNLSVENGHIRQVEKVLASDSKLVRATGSPPPNRPTAHTTPGPDKVNLLWGDNGTNTWVTGDGLASDGSPVEKDDFIVTGLQDSKKGLYALEQVDLFNLLCLPPYMDNAQNVNMELINEAIAYCEKRRAMLLVDPPSDWVSLEDARKGVESKVGDSHKNAALFFPRLLQRNPLRDDQEEAFVPCGAVAGVFARTDTERGVWKAPAGLDAALRNVPKLSVPLTDPEIGELNPKGINCLRAVPAAGRVIWGARTRVGDDRLADEWKYIPVRRTALFIEESLYRGTQWVVFEPNDEPLWAQIRLNVGAFMHGLFRQGAFKGATPRDAYFVKCDRETTPDEDVDRGIVNILVGFAPLKPAEFVVIKLQQIAGQLQA